jgi:hypothetical protein
MYGCIYASSAGAPLLRSHWRRRSLLSMQERELRKQEKRRREKEAGGEPCETSNAMCS